jgi:hypothetical protein
MTMPYRDEQILRILADHPEGLTTGQLLAIAKTQPGNELPNSNITSQRLYALRAPKNPKIVSIDTATGRIHKITAAGREIIAELDSNNTFAAKPDAAEQPNAETPESSDSQLTPHDPDIEKALDDLLSDEDRNTLLEFDAAAATIRNGLKKALIAKAGPVRINNKLVKIELLDKLVSMPLENWAVDLLGQIRADLDNLESA